MPGPTIERPRAYKLNDIEPQHVKGCGRTDESGIMSPVNNMGSIARFPKLDECAHFHYEHVELSLLEVSINENTNDSEEDSYSVRVTSGDACWTLQRSFENFVLFDKQLHRCIFDRKFSNLPKLPAADDEENSEEISLELRHELLTDYMKKFSNLRHDGLNCGPVLNWLQLDNRGRRILVPEADSCPINTPAVAAAYAVRPYTAQAQDELSFQIGDMISVIDMPLPGESNWWRGKHGFAVGFFPAECVAVIGDKVPRHLALQRGQAVRARIQPVKPVLRKHGKLIAFFRSFILNRPSRRRLKQSGILKERVFGCDLGEHLLNSGQDVPTVLTCCAEFIEKYGLVDGIYRLSGVTSNIQRLRNAFDEDRVPLLNSDQGILQDIHSVASLLKMYFRELPNPLCTYQLYSTFVSAVQSATEGERLRKMRDAVRKLPPPHYRTLEYLMRHLVRVAAKGGDTGMTPRNVAIVWAPNLLRCKELEIGGVAALQGVGVQAVVTEFLICYADLIFGDAPLGRPKSLAITTPARLLSLEEARNRSLRGEPDYIPVGAGPGGLTHQYHTVIELPRKRNGSKRSPSLNWRALFGSKGGPNGRAKSRAVGTPPQTETVPNSVCSLRRLRPVKSADSLDGEDGLGPLMGPPPSRTCGHSRSVSHDSYFDHLGDGATNTSPLDLSEIQLNFDLEEREMRMLSEEECTGIASVEASPRRQRTEGSQSTNTNGGSKRKRSRLEERLQCDVELRFIDSQSPDQVMVSADVHEMETPSPLPTPGYLPLLSEASTPMTPATLRNPPISPNTTATSPRISFRSFTLPLEISNEEDEDEELKQISNLRNNSISSDKTSSDTSQTSSRPLLSNFNNGEILGNQNSNASALEVYQRLIESSSNCPIKSQESSIVDKEVKSEILDHEMISCDKINNSTEIGDCSHGKSYDATTCKDSSDALSFYLDSKPICKLENLSTHQEDDTITITSPMENGGGISTTQGIDTTAIPLSNMTDMDSPMSCEQTLDLPDSGFVICDTSDKVYNNSETNSLSGTATDTPEWLMVERTVGSVPSSESQNLTSTTTSEDTLNPAIAEKISEKRSRTSLDLTMCSTVETDTSCINTSDSISSSILNSSCADVLFSNGNENQDSNIQMEVKDQLDSNNSSFNVPKSSSKKSDSENSNSGSNQRISSMRNQQGDNNKSNCDVSVSNSIKANTNCNQENLVQDVIKNSKDQNNISENQIKQKSRNYNNCSPQKLQIQCLSKLSDSKENLKPNGNENILMQDDVDVPCETAAVEPNEMACVPELTPCGHETKKNERDTAKILQELALQRLSGGTNIDLSSPTRRKLDTSDRESKSFDSEIGREIVRQHRMKQELEFARSKTEDSSTISGHNSSQHLPPCLRARHARSTRAALSRSLDEGKFNQMTSESLLSKKQNLENKESSIQHSSTPNVGGLNIQTTSLSRSIQSKNLGLDLDDPRCRERIEKYKQERRTFLRDKYKSESFRGGVTASEVTISTISKPTTSNSKISSHESSDDGEQALLNIKTRLKQRASRQPLH